MIVDSIQPDELPKPNAQVLKNSLKVEIKGVASGVRRDPAKSEGGQLVLSIRNGEKAPWIVIGETERMAASGQLNWTKGFCVEHEFSVAQVCKFELYDVIKGSGKQLLGYCEVPLRDILPQSDTNVQFPYDLLGLNGGRVGGLSLQSFLVKSNSDFLVGRMSFRGLPGSLIGKPRYFFEIVRSFKGVESCIFRSEAKEGESGEWDAIAIPQNLIQSDQPLSFVVKRAAKKPELVGVGKTSVVNWTLNQDIAVMGPKNSPVGTLTPIDVMIDKRTNILDHLAVASGFSLIYSIDFTASNGIQTRKSSLHYCGPEQSNVYESCIDAIARIVYDNPEERPYLLWGFGAIRPTSPAERLPFFRLQSGGEDPRGLSKVHQIYESVLRDGTKLAGPGVLGPTLKEAVEILMNENAEDWYTVLVILTDGTAEDLADLPHQLEPLAALPVSVLIVGIGDSDFYSMKALEAPVGGRAFVEFRVLRDFASPEEMVQSLLRSLPRHVEVFKGTASP